MRVGVRVLVTLVLLIIMRLLILMYLLQEPLIHFM